MTPAAAAKAYSSIFNTPIKSEGAQSAAPGGDFASMVRDALADVEKTGATADKASLQAAAGQGNLVDVVTSVSESELNVQTVVALRDRVIEAYQQIMQMPI